MFHQPKTREQSASGDEYVIVVMEDRDVSFGLDSGKKVWSHDFQGDAAAWVRSSEIWQAIVSLVCIGHMEAIEN